MLLKSSLLTITLAGLINGSFVIPAKFVRNAINEQVWFYHSLIGLALIPWLMLAIMRPATFVTYALLPPNLLLLLLVSGAIFGLGQFCFAYAVEFLGVALGFTINLAIGITLGSLFGVIYQGALFTPKGYLVTLAILLILAGLTTYYFAERDPSRQTCSSQQQRRRYRNGWLLAVLTGCAGGLQNTAFVIVTAWAATQLPKTDTFWVWPPFLLAAACVMLVSFGRRIKKSAARPLNPFQVASPITNTLLVGLMGLCFTGSFVLYSNGMNHLTPQQQIIGWPIFLVSITLASQLWGWFYGESQTATLKSKYYRMSSLLLFATAIFILIKADI